MKNFISLFALAVAGALSVWPPSFAFAETEIAGYVDTIDYGNGSTFNGLTGWAFNPRDPDDTVSAEVWIDGVLAGSTSVSRYRADVASAFGIGSYQGFTFPIPHMWFDGESHEVRVYSVASTGGKTELQGSPFTFAKLDPGVTGYADTITNTNTLNSPHAYMHGWVYDNSNPDLSIPVVAYVDSYTSGQFLGAAAANVARTDVDEAYGVGLYHGFTVPLDLTGLTSGTSIHVAVYAVDTTIGELKHISTMAYQVP